MIGAGKPVIMLKNQTDHAETPFDVYGEYRLIYQVVKDPLTGDVEYPLLARGLERNLQRIFDLCPELKQAQQWKGSQPVDMGWVSRLPKELHRKIVEFLTNLPNILDPNWQRSLVYSAGFDAGLEQQILVAGPPAQFVQILVNTLSQYGKLADGRNALAALLEAAKGQVGLDKRAECERLMNELQG